MGTFLVSFLLAFAAALALTPAMILLARRLGTVDAAGASHRKIHAADIPRLGGVGIVVAFYAPFVGLMLYRTNVGDALLGDPRLATGLLAGGACIALLGLYDDTRGATPTIKLAVQLVAAMMVINAGLRIDRVDLPFLDPFTLGWIGLPLAVLWVVGVTNAVNLIDGLDGLAGGIALVAIVPMAIIAVQRGNDVLALVCCCLAGAVLGFLVFNFHPARIFMGDTGSMFLGFTLSVVAMATATKGRFAVAMLTPVLVLGLPILDTLLALARRAWFGQSLFAGDRQHIHHRLMQKGFSHRGTVLVMYGFAATFAVIGLAMHFRRDQGATMLFVITLAVTGVLLRMIGVVAAPGGELSLASAIRERNKVVRETSDLLERRLDRHVATEAMAHAAAELAFAAGAATARLELKLPGEPTRTWSWAEPVADVPTVERPFALIDRRGRSHGALVVTWQDDGSFHEASLSRLESSVRLLADRVDADLVTQEAEVKAS
jgi:UDP-GlcNAc:undecaprenyl-phosphate GlcNAc-1-phosphate transferase